MIKIKELVIIISSMVLMSVQMIGQNVGIGANTFTPDNSALLEIRGTKGLLIPRMTTTERDSMTSSSTPAQSLLIFNTTTKCYEGYVDGQWNQLWCSCIGFSITASASPSAICQGSNTILSVNGASTYNWSSGLGSGQTHTVSPTTTTTYYVTGVNSSGCTATDSITVNVNSLPTIAINPNPANVCYGSSITLTASGANTYQWNGGSTSASITVTPYSNTTYYVTGYNSNCSNTANITVNVSSLPTITASASPATTCAGSAVVLSASGSGITSYQWNVGQSGSSITVYPTNSTQNTITTTYVVTGTNSYNCSNSSSVAVTVYSSAYGEQYYTTPGTYTFTVPDGVTSICVAAVGGGGGGCGHRGGGNGQVDAVPGNPGGNSSFDGSIIAYGGGGGPKAGETAASGGSYSGGDGGYIGGKGGNLYGGGGGGAATFTGNGGDGADGSPTKGADGGNGGNSGGSGGIASYGEGGGGGGIYLTGTPNTGGSGTSYSAGQYGGGGGGSSVAAGGGGGGAGGGLVWKNDIPVTPGSTYTVVVGAGGAAGASYAMNGASGAVRIIWKTSCSGDPSYPNNAH